MTNEPPPPSAGRGDGEGWRRDGWGSPADGGPQPGWRPATGAGDSPSGWVPPPSGGPAPGAIPHCYRHPTRETYVSCQRCGRPICPDCMRPAAVGFHCPEEQGADARNAGQARRRTPRNMLGGRAAVGRPGIVTQVLIGICVVAYVLQGFPLWDSRTNEFTVDFSLYGPAVAYGDEYYRLITAAFLHGSILHILFNMWALYVLGLQLEVVLGRVRYLALFLVCALGGNTLSYVASDVGPFTRSYSVGASTAVFGFFAAFYLVARRLRVDTGGILLILGLNLVITFSFSGIDIWGHIGGLATGLVVGLVYTYIPSRMAVLQAAAVVAVIASLLIAAVVKSSTVVDPVRVPVPTRAASSAPAVSPAASVLDPKKVVSVSVRDTAR